MATTEVPLPAPTTRSASPGIRDEKPTPGPGRVQPLVPDDLERVARLHQRTFASDAPGGIEPFLYRVFFGHPWHDDAVHPLKLVAPDGALIGCLGAMCRPMALDDRPVRVVVNHNFMVDPDRRGGLPAIQLVRAAYAQRADLAVSEANEPARRIAESLGSTVLETRSTRWIRVLRPVTFGLHVAGRDRLPPMVSGALRRAGSGLDALVGPMVRPPKPSGVEAPMSARTFVDLVDRESRHRRLRPIYTEASASWLLSALDATRKHQTLRARVVLEGREKEPIGWYIYYSRPGRVGRVLQMGALGPTRRQVLEHLFADALAQDNVAVAGQLDAEWRDVLDSSGCFFRSGKTWVIAYTANEALRSLLDGPAALLTRLEGEGWLRFAS